ncbi:MAG: alpha-D-ribose 1-methylphosphonate 5-phosphate C-P-lyase PhnJ, partial [Armatimonadetes bacterium]|nr:alpha-D-ribose 1-methylphosphonate 5-phosphate C-P-lyase PhnJ [Anaerolineae bacterium]
SLVGPESVIKVIDQGADDSVNAANLRRFITRMSGASTTTDALAATILQSRHRIPEEIMREGQLLVLQVPDPEPLRAVQSDSSAAHQMHADADYGQMWLVLYEQLVRYKQYLQGASYPSLVNGRYLISPSPIPRWDTPKLHQAAHLTLLSAGREKRLYAVPPYTDVYPLEFDDVPFQVEDQRTWADMRSGTRHKFMNELPQADGSALYELSDTGYAEKITAGTPGVTYYDQEGTFYHDGYLKPPVQPE